MRTSTAELFQAVSAPLDAVSLAALLEATKGEQLGLTMALDLGAAIAERVGAIHASGRVLGHFDAARVTCTRDGRVLLSREPSAPLAPELRRGEPASVASDVYSVGYLVYQLLTGRTPAQATAAEEVSRLRDVPPPSRFNPKVDAELDAVVLAALRHEPAERPASVMVLQSALDGISEELELTPEPEEIGKRVAKLLDAPKPKSPEPEPVPAPRPSPGAAVATSKLQTSFARASETAPLFPGRAVSPPLPPAPVAPPMPEALTTSKFEPWLPPSEPRPPNRTEPLVSPAEIAASSAPIVTAPFAPAQEEPPLKQTVPMRALRSTSSVPTAPAGARALSLAESVTLLEEAPAAPRQSVATVIEPVVAKPEPVPASLLQTIPVQAVQSHEVKTVVEPPLNSQAQRVAAAVTMVEPVAPHADDAVGDAWLKSPGVHTFIDQDYDDEAAPRESLSPGALGAAIAAGVVLFIALLLAIASPPAPVAVVNDEPAPAPAPVRSPARMVHELKTSAAVEKPAPVVAPTPVAKAAPVAKKHPARRHR